MMNFGRILNTMFGEGRAGSEESDSMARVHFNMGQGGGLSDGGTGMTDLARMYMDSVRPAAPMPAQQPVEPQPAQQPVEPQPAPQAIPPQAMMSLMRPPAMPNFNVTPASGTRPGNFRPTQMNFAVPAPTLLARMMGQNQQRPAFNITPASGTKPKNYRPMQMAMNTPSPAGPDVLMQIMNMMRRPSNPFGQG